MDHLKWSVRMQADVRTEDMDAIGLHSQEHG